jgi:outer membrane protein X
MKNLFTILFVGIFLLALPNLTQAQFAARGGLSYGTEAEHIAIHLGGEYEITEDITGAATFNYYLTGDDYNYWGLNFDGHYIFEQDSGLELYPLAGLNFSHWGFDSGIPGLDFSETKLGLNVGGGVRYPVSDQISLIGEVKYILSDFDQLVITAAALYFFNQ